MTSQENRHTTTSRESDPAITLDCCTDEKLPAAAETGSDETAVGATADAPKETFTTPVKSGAKSWFNPIFFLSVAVLAMATIYFDAWIGPDTWFVPREYAKEEPDRQGLIATKIEFRLRRAEMFFHNEQKIYQARVNLARLLNFRGKYDRALQLIEAANEGVHAASPVSGSFWIQARAYEEQGRYQEAAKLIEMWKGKMPAGYDVAFDLVPFYEYSARIYKHLGDQKSYARAVDLAEKSRYVPREYWEPLTPRATSMVATEPPIAEYKQALNAMMNNDLPESERLLRKIAGDNSCGFQNQLRAEVMLPVVLALQDKFTESNDHVEKAYQALSLVSHHDPFVLSSRTVLLHAKIRAARAVPNKRILKSYLSSESAQRIGFEHLAESDALPQWKSLQDTGSKGKAENEH